MDKELKVKLQERVKAKLAEVAKLSPKEKSALMAEAVEFSRSRNLIKEPEYRQMLEDRQLAIRLGQRSVIDKLSWEAMQELKAEGM